MAFLRLFSPVRKFSVTVSALLTLTVVSLSIENSAVASETTLHKERLENFIHRIYGQSRYMSRRIVDAAYHWAAVRNIPPELILGIITNESSFNTRAIGGLGEIGLMQVYPKAHRREIARIGGKRKLFDPYVNIEMGSKIVASYVHLSHNNVRLGLWHYNGGGSHNPYPGLVLYSYWCLQKVARGEGHATTCKRLRHYTRRHHYHSHRRYHHRR